MALRKSGLAKGREHCLPVAQQPQLVGHGALAFAQQPRRLLLAQILGPHQCGNALGLLYKVQILPL